MSLSRIDSVFDVSRHKPESGQRQSSIGVACRAFVIAATLLSRAVAGNHHRLEVTYYITEGPKVIVDSVVTLGGRSTKQSLIDQTVRLKTEAPMREDELLNPKLLSLSIAGAIFAASGGFSSLIGLLNIAYDVPEGRPYWKTRLVAFGLTLPD